MWPAGLVGIWIGTILYNVSCITPAVLCSLRTPLPGRTLCALQRWAIFVPNVVAGALFVSGSYSCWAMAAQTSSLPELLRRRASTAGFWGFLLYLLVGSTVEGTACV
jgi:hypothetical protein